MRIPFVGPAYRTRSSNQSAQRCVNWYLEMTERGGKTPAALYPCPGTVLKATVGSGSSRNAITFGNFLYAVQGGEVYKIATDYTPTLLGSINTNAGYVSMACNGFEILIVDGNSGYVITLATGVLTEVVDPDFPYGVTWVSFLDGYFIVGGNGTGQFWISGINNANEWVGTEFASAEGDPDPIVGGIVDHRELWLFGSGTVEIWYNTGNVDFPLERTGNAFIEHGCAAVGSISKLDNTVFWLGQDARGDGIVWRAEGYTPQRVSTHGIEYAIGQYGRVDDAISYTYQQEGHAFYVLIFPSANATWCYDTASGEWHERAWLNGADGTLRRHRSNWHVFFNGEHIVGDWENGNLYAFDLDTYTDNGESIKRIRATTVQDLDMNRVFYQYLNLDIEAGVGLNSGQGSDPQMMLRFSDNGGHTWSNTKRRSMGRIGQYNARCKWEQLGAGRQRVWEISITDPVKAVILGAVVMVKPGSS